MSTTEKANPIAKIKEELNIWYVNPESLDLHGKPSKFKMVYAKFMIFWAIFSQIFLLLQVIKIFSNQNATGVSESAFFLYAIGCVIWFVYARFVLSRRNMPLAISNVEGFVLSVMIIVGIYLYR